MMRIASTNYDDADRRFRVELDGLSLGLCPHSYGLIPDTQLHRLTLLLLAYGNKNRAFLHAAVVSGKLTRV